MRRVLIVLTVVVGIFLIAIIPFVISQTSLANRNEYVKMIYNTNQCLVNCYTDYLVCNPTVNSISLSDSKNWNISFVNSEYLLDWGVEIFSTEAYPVNQKITDIDGRTIGWMNYTGYRNVWNDFDAKTTILPDDCITVRVWGKKKATIETQKAVDNILSFAGYQFKEYAWGIVIGSRKKQ